MSLEDQHGIELTQVKRNLFFFSCSFMHDCVFDMINCVWIFFYY